MIAKKLEPKWIVRKNASWRYTICHNLFSTPWYDSKFTQKEIDAGLGITPTIKKALKREVGLEVERRDELQCPNCMCCCFLVGRGENLYPFYCNQCGELMMSEVTL